MSFKHPWFFVLIIPVVLLLLRAYFNMVKGKYSPLVVTPWEKLWKLQPTARKMPPRFWHSAGYSIAAILICIALARPQTSFHKTKRTTEGIDILLILDMSASMRIEDFRDANRMDVAKSVIRDFINGRQSDRIGLVAFSGEPISLAPPTLDYSLVQQQLKNIEIGDLRDGTAIGDGLSLGVTRLSNSKSKTKVIILVTDGDNNMGQVDPLTAGELAKGFGIKVYSIALGREGRVRMPFVQKDLFGRTYKTYQYYDNSINPELLRQISASTGGKFYRVEDDPNGLRDVFSEIDQLEKTTIETSEQVKYDEKFAGILRLALMVLTLTWLLQQTLLRVFP